MLDDKEKARAFDQIALRLGLDPDEEGAPRRVFLAVVFLVEAHDAYAGATTAGMDATRRLLTKLNDLARRRLPRDEDHPAPEDDPLG